MCNGIMAGMGLWALLSIVVLVAVLVLAALGSVWLFRQLRGGTDRDNPASVETAKELLRRRYAAGEIEDEEYERRLTALTSWR